MADLTAMLQAAAGAVGGEYEIERSLRFNSADSAYLNRTPASAGNRKTWTWSGWVKRSKLGMSNAIVFGSGDTYVNFETDRLAVNLRPAGTNYLGISTAKFRDVSAWYHIVAAVDTTQATAADRLKMWVNNQLITAFDVSSYLDIPVNTDTAVNSTNAHNIGRYTGTGEHFDGYMTEINFIDGQALTPSSFGEINADTGVWSPIEYTGTYGTNGFYLNFSDNTSTTTLGDDLSGNGNDWTTNNFSVTAGAGNDSLVDSPTRFGTDTGAGGQVRGNYATLNPLDNGGLTISNGNLQFDKSSVNWISARSTMGLSSGKWYWEVTATANSGTFYCMVGIALNSATLANYFAASATGWAYSAHDGGKYNNDAFTAYGSTWTTGDVIGIAFDADAGTLVFYKNNASQGTAYTGLTSGPYIPAVTLFGDGFGTQTAVINFGQRPFAYTAPSGFKALVTTNLPDPTIVEGDEYFNTVLYTGDGASTRSITGTGFQPDWVWVKRRDDTSGHYVWDVIRGTNLNLETQSTAAELNFATSSSNGGIGTSVSDGFSIVSGTVGATNVNTNNGTYVSWQWKANGAGSSNTAGTISSTVSVSTTSGFSIVTYTGTGSAATVGHGLGAVPRMIIVKNRDAADAWQVYHAANTANPETDYLVLNTSAATADAADRWNDTLPTSTVFNIGNGVEVNTNTEKYVAYCFAPVAGYSAFGSYTGNASADGPFVFTGFRPAWVMIKSSSNTTNWYVYDSARNTFNLTTQIIYPNLSDPEATGVNSVLDILSNGFKIRDPGAGELNISAATYIYACFATSPFKLSLAR